MFEAIGMSPSESRLYTALVDNPRSSAPEVAKDCELTPVVAARMLGQFVRRGLATRLPGKQARYVAVAPDISLQPLLKRRDEELQQARAAVHDLVLAFHRATRHAHPAELIEVVTGQENMAKRALAVQHSAERLMRGMDKPPYFVPDTECSSEQVHRLDEGIEYRVIYDRDVLNRPGRLDGIRALSRRGEQARVLPAVPLKMILADESAAFVPMRSANYAVNAALVIYPSALLDAMITMFELAWERAVPLRLYESGGDTVGASAGAVQGPDETGKKVLAMLAAGLTDEAMARALGLSLRTLQRRIHELMDQLNADTRFQAGMVAHDRGWV